MTPHIPLIAWLPDADPTVPGVVTSVSNLIPTQRGYVPDYAASESGVYNGNALPDVCYGAARVTLGRGSTEDYVFAATADRIYFVDTGVNIDRTPLAPAVTSFSSAAPARFGSFQSYVFCVGEFTRFRYSSALTVPRFIEPGNVPAAQTIATNRGHVILAGFSKGEMLYPYPDGWWCSASENPLDWTVDIATGSARGLLTATPGGVLRLVTFGEYTYAFKGGAIHRGTFVGRTGGTFSWPVLSTSVGIVGHDAVCEAQGALYWMAADGIYRTRGGGVERINSCPWQYVVGIAGTEITLGYTQAQYDPVARVIRWYLKDFLDGNSYRLTAGLAYHPETDRWGLFNVSADWSLTVARDTVRGRAYSGLREQRAIPAVIDAATHQVHTYRSVPAASSLTTGDIGDDDAAATLRRARVRFLSTPTTSFATQYHRMTLDGALTTGETIARSDGKYDLTHAARWHRLKFAQTGDYEVVGFRVDAANAGRR